MIVAMRIGIALSPAGSRPGPAFPAFVLLVAMFFPPAGRASSLPSPGDAALADPQAPAAAAPAYAPDRLVMRLRAGPAREVAARAASALGARAAELDRLGVAALDRVAARFGARFEPEFRGESPPAAGSAAIDFTAFWIVHLGAEADRDEALVSFGALSEVESAEPIAVLPVAAVPADSLWAESYYFYQASRRDIHAPEAWSVTTGDTAVIVAIVDTGIIPYHPDLGGVTPGLRGQLWTNWAEQGGVRGVDDDRNGFVDDTWGWDFVHFSSPASVLAGEDWRDEDNDPKDYAGHGTPVAGVVGAVTDNRIGVTGTAWQVRLMALRVGWSSPSNNQGDVDMSYAAKAIRYATRMGASVINCSFTSTGQADLNAAVTAASAAGILLVNAAGNNGTAQHYLSDREDVLSVAATDRNDKLAAFSNRGSYVDMCAPGSNLSTTTLRSIGTDSLGYRQPNYSTGANGTSFSAPLAAGVAALVQADRRARGLPPLSTIELKLRLMDTADDITVQNPGVYGWGSGRINAYRALTDPPTSLARPIGTRTVGPAVVLPTTLGARRIVFVTGDRRMVFMDGTTGATLRTVRLPAPAVGGLAAADLGNGRGPGLFVATDNGSIFGFDGTGEPLPGWPVSATRTSYVRSLEPVLADLDGDGTIEVAWGGVDGYVYAWRQDGTRMSGFPRFINGPGENILLAASDLDGEPGAELIAASYWGSVDALKGDGSALPGWPVSLDLLPTPPVVGRLGASPDPAVIIAAGNRLVAYSPQGALVLDVTEPGLQVESPALADLDGDGQDEIVLARTLPEELLVVDSAGEILTLRGWPRILSSQAYGAPVVGALVAGDLSGIAMCVRKSGGAQLLGMTARDKDLRGYPKMGVPGVDLTLDDVDGDGATEIVAGAGADSLFYVYDAGPGTFDAAAQQWPTPRANYARTGSRLYSPPLGAVDDVPPLAVADLEAAAVTETTVALRWTAPADPGLGRVRRYELRHARSPIDAVSFPSATPVPALPAPGPPGGSDSVVVRGLAEGVRYYIALRSWDAAANSSALSNPLEVATSSVAPAAVADLAVTATDYSSVTLAWTATGDDGALGKPATYRIRGTTGELDEASFEAAPIHVEIAAATEAGGVESARVTGLEHGAHYRFALKATDEAGNVSPLSNVVAELAGPLAPARGVAVTASLAPAYAPVEIFWQGNGLSPAGQMLGLYDLAGRQLAVMPVTGAEGRVTWDGRDQHGRAMPAGLYFARLVSGPAVAAARIVLLR